MQEENKINAICVGCGQHSESLGEYNDDNPVEFDGTYSMGKFVCNPCYMYLIDLGLDVGSPTDLQERAIQLVRPLNQ